MQSCITSAAQLPRGFCKAIHAKHDTVLVSKCRTCRKMCFHLVFSGVWISSRCQAFAWAVAGSRRGAAAQPSQRLSPWALLGAPRGEEPLPGCCRGITARESHRDHRMAFLNQEQAVLSLALLPRGQDPQQGLGGSCAIRCNILYLHEETEAITMFFREEDQFDSLR